MVKKALLFTCLLIAISELALSQKIRKEYRIDLRIDPNKDMYPGEVFCVVSSEHSTDTLLLTDHGLYFKDSLPALLITVFIKSDGDSAFRRLAAFDSLNRDTSLSLPCAVTPDEELFIENDGVMMSKELLQSDSILGQAIQPCLQVRVLTFQYFESYGELYRYRPLDGEIRRTQEIKDFLFRSPWSYYILED